MMLAALSVHAPLVCGVLGKSGGGLVYDGFQEDYASERFDWRQIAGSGVTLSAQRSAAEVEE
jgi:hypothetical protein